MMVVVMMVRTRVESGGSDNGETRIVTMMIRWLDDCEGGGNDDGEGWG